MESVLCTCLEWIGEKFVEYSNSWSTLVRIIFFLLQQNLLQYTLCTGTITPFIFILDTESEFIRKELLVTGLIWITHFFIRLLSLVLFIRVAQSCPTLRDPMDYSTPGLPVHHQLLEFTQTHVHWVSDAIQPSHPLSSPSPPAFDCCCSCHLK